MQRVVGAHGASPVCRDVVPGILFLVALFGIVTLGASGASSGFDHLIPAGVNVTAKEQRLVGMAAAYGAGGGAVTTMIYYLLMACSRKSSAPPRCASQRMMTWLRLMTCCR